MSDSKMRCRYKPCGTCPFLKGGRGLRGLGVNRSTEIKESLLRGESFTCHNDLELRPGARAQCVGAMLILQKLDRPNTAMQLLTRLNIMDLTKLRGKEAVFDNFEQWAQSQVE